MDAVKIGRWGWIRASLPNIAVLGCLAGVALWGHVTHWTFLPTAEKTDKPAKPLAPALELVAAAQSELEVAADSDLELAQTGIRLGYPLTRPMEEVVTAHGVVTYVQTKIAQLSARVPGTVWRVDCKVGDPVARGQVLAILDAADVGQAKAAFLQAMVHAELKEATLERLRGAADAVPARLLREAESALREAHVNRYIAQQTLINLGLPIHHEDLLSLTDEQRAQQVQFLGMPRAIVDDLDPETTTANLIPVKAPFDGVVIRREIVVGEVVSPEHSQLAIADISRMHLRLDVSKEDALRVSLGQTVSFSADGMPGAIESHVTWISTEVDEKTRTVPILALVDNPSIDLDDDGRGHRLLKANMFGIGKIRIRHQGQALVVPSEAVQWTGSQHVVFVAERRAESSAGEEGWAFQMRRVRPGSSDAGFTEIMSGLDSDEQIVIDGSHMLKSEIMQSTVTHVERE